MKTMRNTYMLIIELARALWLVAHQGKGRELLEEIQ